VYGLGTFNDVHPVTAYRLYLKSDVLGTAVHRIAHEIAGMEFGLTTDGQDFEQDAPVIQFLNSSSEGYSKRRFFYEIAVSYLLTNEAWPILRGRVNRPPVARTWVYPFDVIDDQSDRDGLPVTFRTIGDRDRQVYEREEQDMQLRFIDSDEVNELIPILGAEAINRPYRGQSQLAQLYYSISQNVEGKRHNVSLLRNGLRTSGGVMPPTDEGTFSEKTVRDIQAAFQAMRGAATAGGTLVMPSAVRFLELGVSNQEMDYVNLINESKETVFNFYGIPLPLMMNDASTFNNFATAQTAFFDTAVFPVVDDILDALTAGLRHRFPELATARITYNENTIKALKGRNLKRMTEARGTHAITTNEIREMGGYEPMEDGEDILVPSTLVAMGDSGMSFPGEGAPTPLPEEDDLDTGTIGDGE
jgi:HK97 family phage portal protein